MEEKVYLTIPESAVGDGFWDGDEHAEYAIAMDGDGGQLVWRRSLDWREFARWFGFGRIARIS